MTNPEKTQVDPKPVSPRTDVEILVEIERHQRAIGNLVQELHQGALQYAHEWAKMQAATIPVQKPQEDKKHGG